MSDETGKPTTTTPIGGIVITLVVIIAIAGWILLDLKRLGITSFFASFYLFWHGAAVEEADRQQWMQRVLVAFVSLALAW